MPAYTSWEAMIAAPSVLRLVRMNANSISNKLCSYCLTIMLLSCAASLRADPPDRDHLPPGLAKKDKLPPGWQKKVGQQSQNGTNASATSTSVNSTAPVTPPATTDSSKPSVAAKPTEPSAPADTKPTSNPGTASTPTSTSATKPLTRDQQERYTRLDGALADLEAEASRAGAADRVMARLARLTETPLAKLREQWKAHPGVSVAEFYLATQIATGKHITVEPVLAARKSGKSWGEIADEYRARTGELAQGLQGAKAAARDAADTAERKAQQVAK
jgi:hypothetical protein